MSAAAQFEVPAIVPADPDANISDLLIERVKATPSLALFAVPEGGCNLEEVERQLVLDALEKSGWNQKEAAGLLGISVDRMNSRVRKFGIRHPGWRVNR